MSNSSDNLTICYSGIQRIYRNTIVCHVRERMIKLYPNDHSEKISSLFKKEELERIKENSTIAKESGELSVAELDIYDILSVNHFYNIFEKFYSVLIDDANPGRKIEKNRPRQMFLSWVKEIKNIRDPLSHPSEIDFGYEDSFRLLDSARRVLYRIHSDIDAQKIELLMGSLSGGANFVTEERQPLDDQLPPKEMIVSNFVGRENELKSLREWFGDPLTRRWALSGEGGKGKTAIAYKFASDVKIKAPEPFVTILWLSAKRRKYIDGRTVDVNTVDFHDLDSAISALLVQYGWVDEVANPLNEKKEFLVKLLNDFPSLIVVDDIDSIDIENEDAIEFFSFNVPQTKSKILFTSRRILFGMGKSTTHVGSFDANDAEKFINNISSWMLSGPQIFSKKQIGNIIKVTDGSPLFIEDLMRFYLSFGSLDEALEMWGGQNGNEARKYALQREVEMLSTDAKCVLISACVNNGKISIPEISAITKLSNGQIVASVQELQKLFLIPKPTIVEGEKYFEININTLKLVKDVFGPLDLYRRIKSSRDALERGASEFIKGHVGGLIRQAVALSRTNDNPGAEKLLQNAIEKYRNPDLLGVLGVVYKRWRPQRTVDARICFEESCKLNSLKEDTYEHWCRMEIDNLEWSKAIQAAKKGIKKIPDSKLLYYWAGYSCCRLAKDLERNLNREKSINAAREGFKYFEKSKELRCDDECKCVDLDLKILRGLVLVNEMLGDLKQVKVYFKAWGGLWDADPDLKSEKIRISKKYSILYSDL